MSRSKSVKNKDSFENENRRHDDHSSNKKKCPIANLRLFTFEYFSLSFDILFFYKNICYKNVEAEINHKFVKSIPEAESRLRTCFSAYPAVFFGLYSCCK